MNAVLQFFASLGLTLTHLPEDGDYREMWQYDGYIDAQVENDLVIQAHTGTNGLGLPGCWVTISSPARNIDCEYTCTLSDWLESYGDELRRILQ